MTNTFRLPPSMAFLAFSAIAAAVASTAAFTSLHLGFAPWAMFIGWVAYFTRPTSARQGVYTWLCVLCGLTMGTAAIIALQSLTPLMGPWALALVVFVVATVVVSMRAVRALDNILAWFLGLIAFFAAHLEPSLGTIAELGGASALGSVAGWAAQRLQGRLTAAH